MEESILLDTSLSKDDLSKKWMRLTKPKLVEECEKRSLDISGLKLHLTQRIVDHIFEHAPLTVKREIRNDDEVIVGSNGVEVNMSAVNENPTSEEYAVLLAYAKLNKPVEVIDVPAVLPTPMLPLAFGGIKRKRDEEVVEVVERPLKRRKVEISNASLEVKVSTIIENLKKNIKSEKMYREWECISKKVISVNDIWRSEEFEELFNGIGKGSKVSSIITRDLDMDDLHTVFGSALENIQCNLYSRPRNFQRQYKLGTGKIPIVSASVIFRSNTGGLLIKFSCGGEIPSKPL